MAAELEPLKMEPPEVVEEAEEAEGQTKSLKMTEDLLAMVKKLQKEGSLEPQIEDLINRINDLQQENVDTEGEKLDQDGPQWEMGAGSKKVLPLPWHCAVPSVALICLSVKLQSGHRIWPLEAQSVTVFSSEWRESAPRGGLEQKARGTEDSPAALPKEGEWSSEVRGPAQLFPTLLPNLKEEGARARDNIPWTHTLHVEEQLENLMGQHKDLWEFHMLKQRLAWEIRALQSSKEQLLTEEKLARAKLEEVERQLSLPPEAEGGAGEIRGTGSCPNPLHPKGRGLQSRGCFIVLALQLSESSRVTQIRVPCLLVSCLGLLTPCLWTELLLLLPPPDHGPCAVPHKQCGLCDLLPPKESSGPTRAFIIWDYEHRVCVERQTRYCTGPSSQTEAAPEGRSSRTCVRACGTVTCSLRCRSGRGDAPGSPWN
ncbi:hypothetical protein PANDA_019611 [Ailuropoda melanoleuca]|uniref:Synaptonemal complex central element protein 1 like n=1 Tax=Ailuropoda melanoleuca TaxID=9646 RepID=D2I2I5_AILME|nr:hypothetical protein PANDA_019611 [Ailuropoda melanoleuca]